VPKAPIDKHRRAGGFEPEVRIALNTLRSNDPAGKSGSHKGEAQPSFCRTIVAAFDGAHNGGTLA
jgi:hypothetical protein